MKRTFCIVLDSLGIGALPDAADYGDEGSNTLKAISGSDDFRIPNLLGMGLGQIDGVDLKQNSVEPVGAFSRLREQSAGKDTTIGHWELSGLVSRTPLPVYPQGFPADVILQLETVTGRKILCNLPYSGTQVILDYGPEHEKTGDLILYTSADSVAQFAAHEEVVPLQDLYKICEQARNILTGPHSVGRVIARPFAGTYPEYQRTPNRHDFSLKPHGPTILDRLMAKGLDTIAVGKIYDIFAGQGIRESYPTKGNDHGMAVMDELVHRDFHGLCFVNLVDFDMLYGHRNDLDGYARALSAFDSWLGGFLLKLRPEDLVMITADHGCDPATPSTDHSREYVPLLLYGNGVSPGENLGTKDSFAFVSEYIWQYFDS